MCECEYRGKRRKGQMKSPKQKTGTNAMVFPLVAFLYSFRADLVFVVFVVVCILSINNFEEDCYDEERKLSCSTFDFLIGKLQTMVTRTTLL